MTYKQIIDEILSFAKRQQVKEPNGEYIVGLAALYQHFASKFPDLDKRSISEVIEEIDARGWLLKSDKTKLIFDPATFR